MVKQVEALYRRKERKVMAVQWTGDIKQMPPLFRAHTKASVAKGRIEPNDIGGAVVKRALTTSGVRKGDWLLRDEDGCLEVISDERFRVEYEPLKEGEKAL